MKLAHQDSGDGILALVVDIVIILIAIVASATLFIQHSSSSTVTTDTREEQYVRPVDPTIDLIFGNPNADLFIVEYADLECPHCQEFHPTIQSFIKSKWGKSGKVAWVWRNGFHINETSIEKARTLECIRRYPGPSGRMAVWQFIEESLRGGVYEGSYPTERYREIMERFDIPAEEVEACREQDSIAAHIAIAAKDVVELDIEETPHIQFISRSGELLFDGVGVLSATELESFVAHIMQSRRQETED
ncbi:MAG: thioredoxin domain-containing protein [Candidatus Kaiserbacteria bacterium]|nr:thioredoxin domain-containing protein [Candidatus Kaiserbacteria bacterium]